MTQLTDIDYNTRLPDTSVKLFLSLFTGALTPHPLWQSKPFRGKFLLRALIMPVSTFKVLNMLTQHPAYPELLQAQPRLPCRLHRPYLSNRLTRRECTDAIVFHYKKVTTVLDETSFIKHLSAEGIRLCSFSGKDGSDYYINFISTRKLDREGEASLILKRAEGQMLAEITFTLCEKEQQTVIITGGLQGPNNPDSQQIVQAATKNLYGIFPKKMVFEALLVIARFFNVNQILAVSNKAHVYSSLRYKNRQKHMHADYDSFWKMVGGVPTDRAMFSLPLATTRKGFEEIASKKRAEYRRRYELLDKLTTQIETGFRLKVAMSF